MKLFSALSLVYLMFTAALYVFQRSMQYFPDTRLVHPGDMGLNAFTTVNLKAQDGTGLVAWYAPAHNGSPTIVYFQGNAQGISARWERFKNEWYPPGFRALVKEYFEAVTRPAGETQ